MRLPRYRFNLRFLMIAVVFAALALGLASWSNRRAARFWALFDRHREECFLLQECYLLEINFGGVDIKSNLPANSGRLAEIQRYWVYHKAMRDKYRQLALYPWLPVGPDPPKP